MNSVQTTLTAVAAVGLAQLLLIIPILGLYIRSVIEKKTNELQVQQAANHSSTAAKLDSVVEQLTSTNGHSNM